jgi:hypothetical protein
VKEEGTEDEGKQLRVEAIRAKCMKAGQGTSENGDYGLRVVVEHEIRTVWH